MAATSEPAPDLMPVLSRGKHRDPARGACFLEYTSLLAGEPFSDEPACVDRELAAVLRRANDLLGDEARARLVPLLGRAMGLVVPVDRPRPAAGLTADQVDPALAELGRATATLHRRVAARFLAAVGCVPDPGELRRFDGGRELAELFWHLMGPRGRRGHPSPNYADRLIDRLHLLHACFEQELRPAAAAADATAAPADLTLRR
jgi:hypothetical protein